MLFVSSAPWSGPLVSLTATLLVSRATSTLASPSRSLPRAAEAVNYAPSVAPGTPASPAYLPPISTMPPSPSPPLPTSVHVSTVSATTKPVSSASKPITTYAPAVSTLPAVILPPSRQSASDLLANYSLSASMASTSLVIYAPPRSTASPNLSLTPIYYPGAKNSGAAPTDLVFASSPPPVMSTMTFATVATDSASAARSTATAVVVVPSESSFTSIALATQSSTPSGTPSTQATSSAARTPSVWGSKTWILGLGIMGLLVL